jgi:lipopolysaccharide/colanic/teichoic acid biosynthesis glycosyltransferase
MFPIVVPMFLIIPPLIRLDSRGSIFFRQPRVWLGGVPFFLHKFRAMTHGADSRLSELLDNDHAARKEFTASYKLRDDPRFTRVGRLLRRTSLDELPLSGMCSGAI